MQGTKFYNAAGAARFVGKSEAWARYSFANGSIPSEAWVNAAVPLVTAATLKKLAPKLRKRQSRLN